MVTEEKSYYQSLEEGLRLALRHNMLYEVLTTAFPERISGPTIPTVKTIHDRVMIGLGEWDLFPNRSSSEKQAETERAHTLRLVQAVVRELSRNFPEDSVQIDSLITRLLAEESEEK